MSYTALYRITVEGEIETQKEFRNAHGWASFIWDALVKKYEITELRAASDWVDPDAGLSFGCYADWGYLWHLHAQDKLELKPWEHNVLLSTYDRHIVKAADFQLYARSLGRFNDAHGVPNRVNHVGPMAEQVWLLNATDTREKLMGLCFYPMSVSDDYWFEWDAEAEESVQYDFEKGTKHRVVEMVAL